MADTTVATSRSGGVTFQLTPSPPFRLDLTVWALRRREANAVDRWDGVTYRRVLPLGDTPAEVAVTQTAPPDLPELRVSVTGVSTRAGIKSALAPVLERMLGLRIDLGDFYRIAADNLRLAPLVERFRGMRPPRFPTVFEALVNGIACQQMSLTIGILLLNRLSQSYGAVAAASEANPHAFPSPARLAVLEPSALRPLGFSMQKSRAIVETSRAVCEGHLDLEALTALSNAEAVEQLRQLRGVGRWTAEYVVLRGLGRWDLFPGDDVGARNTLTRWLRPRKPLDYLRVRRLLARWKGYAGLVYFHLLLDRLAAMHLL